MSDYYVTEFDDPNPLVHEFLWQWPALDKNTGDKLNRIAAGLEDDRKHGAIDIGTLGVTHDVVAAADGEIIDLYSDYEENGNRKNGCGNYIFIKHNNINGKTYYSRYIHLDSIEEELYIGKTVKAGQKIAIIGQTGGEYPIHLDFQIGELTKYSYKSADNTNIKIEGGIIDPVLFNQKYNSQDKSSGVVKSKFNMLINIPIDLKNVCTGDNGHSCDDCLKFFDCNKYREHLNLYNKDYLCEEHCIKCRYKLRDDDGDK